MSNSTEMPTTAEMRSAAVTAYDAAINRAYHHQKAGDSIESDRERALAVRLLNWAQRLAEQASVEHDAR